MAARKTAISIEEGLFARADSLARELGVSRSQLYSRALESFVRQKEDLELLAEIDEAYSAAETPSERKRRTLTRGYAKRLAEGEW